MAVAHRPVTRSVRQLVCYVCREEDAAVQAMPCECRGTIGIHERCRTAYINSMLDRSTLDAIRDGSGIERVPCRICRKDVEMRATLEPIDVGYERLRAAAPAWRCWSWWRWRR